MHRPGLLLGIGLLLGAGSGIEAQQRYDLLITGGTVLDGTGAAGYRADLLVQNGRIVRISRERLSGDSARRVIDAAGLMVSPGFIDLHAHIEGLPRMPDAESHVRQGVTLAIGGPDGAPAWGNTAVGTALAGSIGNASSDAARAERNNRETNSERMYKSSWRRY